VLAVSSLRVHICRRSSVDLRGMDVSWNSSQWVSIHRDVSPTHSDASDDELLPQLDGLTDNKSTLYVYLMPESVTELVSK